MSQSNLLPTSVLKTDFHTDCHQTDNSRVVLLDWLEVISFLDPFSLCYLNDCDKIIAHNDQT